MTEQPDSIHDVQAVEPGAPPPDDYQGSEQQAADIETLRPYLDENQQVRPDDDKRQLFFQEIAGTPAEELTDEQRKIHDAAARMFGAWAMTSLAHMWGEHLAEQVKKHGGTITREQYRHGELVNRTVDHYPTPTPQNTAPRLVHGARQRAHRPRPTRSSAASGDSGDDSDSDGPGEAGLTLLTGAAR
jgi:hypothetical protein